MGRLRFAHQAWLALLVSLAVAPLSGQALPPTLQKSFGSAAIPLNGTTTLTFTITNPNSGGLTGVGFTDDLPAGLVVATPNNAFGSCGGGATFVPVDGATSVSVSGGFIPADSTEVCHLDVTGTTLGIKVNTTSTITSNESSPGDAATATVTVAPAATVPATSREGWAAAALLLAVSGYVLSARGRA